MYLSSSALLIATILPFAAAHFVLQIPTSLGFSDINEVQAPCGGFDIKSRNTVTEWPLGGHPIGVVSTHPNAHWQIRAALLENTDEFVDLIPDIRQDGMGNFCLRSVPGYADWVGKDAVLQVIQTAVDGQLYQCAAIQFVEGEAASTPGNCRNATNIVASIDPDYTGQATAPASAPTSPLTTAVSSVSSETTTAVPTTTGSSGANRSAEIPFLGILAVVIYVLDFIMM
ncbi:hypothetical protein ABW19_dt0206763 [Dactylella cylindrospora]|nr:hypothetical protein ABW19_dt0206763 [Dactylella cylindrospora]